MQEECSNSVWVHQRPSRVQTRTTTHLCQPWGARGPGADGGGGVEKRELIGYVAGELKNNAVASIRFSLLGSHLLTFLQDYFEG